MEPQAKAASKGRNRLGTEKTKLSFEEASTMDVNVLRTISENQRFEMEESVLAILQGATVGLTLTEIIICIANLELLGLT